MKEVAVAGRCRCREVTEIEATGGHRADTALKLGPRRKVPQGLGQRQVRCERSQVLS